MSTVWQSGRESQLLDAIIAGHKTIEGRLNRDKFALYKPGDIVELRRDYRDQDGVLHDGQPNAARVEVVAVRHYKSFTEMVEREAYKNVMPYAVSEKEAVAEYDRYYSTDDQKQYGVLAIEIRFIPDNPAYNTV